jgi:catechol 2,3-dioxygenase-like lactoylglutathione lyase family enzyme
MSNVLRRRESTMIGKGIFHTHLVVSDLAKSLKFYTGLFGMQEMDFRDGVLAFLTTPGRNDLLVLNPGGDWGYPGGCAKEQPREEHLAGVQGGAAHFGYMLPTVKEYERAITSVTEFGGRLVVRCDHGGAFTLGRVIGPPLMGMGFDSPGSYSPVLGGFVVTTLMAAGLMTQLGPYRVWEAAAEAVAISEGDPITISV